MAKLRVAFIGCGQISQLHAAAYRDYEHAELVGLCDARPELLERRAREWGVERTFPDYRELLEDPNIDAVEILLPHKLHRRVAEAALAAGKHVSLQKPMAMTMAECDSLVRAAEAAARRGVYFRVFENYRYYPAHVKAKQLLEEGAIGEPSTIRLKMNPGQGGWNVDPETWKWHLSPAQVGGGNLIVDDGYHKFSLMRYFLGPVAKLVAWIDVHELGDGASFDLPGVVMWKYEAPGRYGIWDLALSHEMLIPNSRYYAADERVEITGSAGVLWVNGCTSRLTQEAPLQLYRDGHLTAYHDLPADWGVSFVASSRHFCESILAGIQPDLDAEEARAIQKLAWAAEASSREGRAIVLDEFHPE